MSCSIQFNLAIITRFMWCAVCFHNARKNTQRLGGSKAGCNLHESGSFQLKARKSFYFLLKGREARKEKKSKT